MNITLNIILFSFILIFGLYITNKLEYDLKLIKILRFYPIASKIRGEGLIDLSNLSLLMRGYDVEYDVEGDVEVRRGEGDIYRVVARGEGKVRLRIIAYGAFDEYSITKVVEASLG